MFELDIQSVSTIIAAIGVTIGLFLTFLELRHLRGERQTNLVTSLYSTFGSEEHQRAGNLVSEIEYKDYDDFVKKYGAPSSEEPIPLAATKVLYFFEEVGVLLKKELITIDMVDQLFGFNITVIGHKIIPIIEEARKRANERRYFQNFEYLYNEVKKREQRQ